MKVGVIIGSIRKGRTAEKVATWLRENIGEREGFEYESSTSQILSSRFTTAPASPCS